MRRNKRRIAYAVSRDDGLVISRVDNEIAVPVLQYDEMLPVNNFTPTYKLEKMDINTLYDQWRLYKWTKKIPVSLKNRHREFWGFKPLREEKNEEASEKESN